MLATASSLDFGFKRQSPTLGAIQSQGPVRSKPGRYLYHFERTQSMAVMFERICVYSLFFLLRDSARRTSRATNFFASSKEYDGPFTLKAFDARLQARWQADLATTPEWNVSCFERAGTPPVVHEKSKLASYVPHSGCYRHFPCLYTEILVCTRRVVF